MRIIILTAVFVSALAANEDQVSGKTESLQKSDKLKGEALQSIPTSYEFKYSTGQEGPAQLFREEYRDHDGTVKGKYGYVDPNGKLRVIEYKAGAGGYSASGDIGPDSVAQNEAQSAFRNDPSVRAQTDVWNRAQSGNLGANNWNSQPLGWSSVDPLWNIDALPKGPSAQPVQPASQYQHNIAQPRNQWQNQQAQTISQQRNQWSNQPAQPQSRPPPTNQWSNQPAQPQSISPPIKQWSDLPGQPQPISPPINQWSNQPAQPQPISPSSNQWSAPQPGLGQPQTSRISDDKNQIWDEKVQKNWDNSNENWQRGDRRSSGAIDWSKWNANQQTWTKPTTNNAQQYTSNVNHQWQQSSVSSLPPSSNQQAQPQLISPPTNQWSNQPAQPQSIPPPIKQWSDQPAQPQPISSPINQWSNQPAQPQSIPPPIKQWSDQPAQPQPISPPINQWSNQPAQPQPISPPSNQWSGSQPGLGHQQPQTQPQGLDQWTPPAEGPTAGRWSQMPQNPTAGQWTKFDQNVTPDRWSQPQAVPQLSQPSQPSQPSLPELKEKWTGISTSAQRSPNEEQWNKQLAGPPTTRPEQTNWQAQPQTPANWQSQQQPAPVNWQAQSPGPIRWGKPVPTQTIADQWRRNDQGSQIVPTKGQDQFNVQPQSPSNWQSGVQYDARPSPQWSQTPSKVARIGEQAPSPVSEITQDEPSPRWQQPSQPGQPPQFEQPKAVPRTITPTNIRSNQWPVSGGLTADNDIFGGQPFVQFRIEHTVDPNQPPLRYQYSY